MMQVNFNHLLFKKNKTETKQESEMYYFRLNYSAFTQVSKYSPAW